MSWYSFALTALIVFVSSMAMLLILQSALKKDTVALQTLRRFYRLNLRTYRQSNVAPEAPLMREVAWRRLSGQIFKKPQWPLIYSACVGIGVEVVMIFYLVVLNLRVSNYSFVSASVQTWCMILCIPSLSIMNGYIAARLYKFFNGVHWSILTLSTSTFLPALVLGTAVILNVCEYFQTKRVTLNEYFWLTAVLAVAMVPFGFAGCYLGFH